MSDTKNSERLRRPTPKFLSSNLKTYPCSLQIEGFIDSWVLPPMVERYTTACKSLNTGDLMSMFPCLLQIEGFIDSWVLPPMGERYTSQYWYTNDYVPLFLTDRRVYRQLGATPYGGEIHNSL